MQENCNSMPAWQQKILTFFAISIIYFTWNIHDLKRTFWGISINLFYVCSLRRGTRMCTYVAMNVTIRMNV